MNSSFKCLTLHFILGNLHTFTHKVFLKRLLSLAILLIVSRVGVFGQAADFTTNPSHISGDTLKVCAGSSILFTLQSGSGNLSSSSTINWTFTTVSGSNPSITNTQNRSPFYVEFPNGIYKCTLSVDNGQSLKILVIKATAIGSYQPNLSLNGISPWVETAIDNIVTFRICPTNYSINLPLSLSVNPNVNTSNCTFSMISSPNLTWTLNTPPNISTINSTLPAPSNPSNRFYYLMSKSQFSNCTLTEGYYIQVGAPSISKTDGSNFVCDPGGYQFLFNEQQPGVTYELDWNFDGSTFNSMNTYAYPNLPLNPQFLNYNYPFIPCTSGNAPQRKIRIKATNQCTSGNVSISDITNIFVSKGPTAKFSCNPDPNVTSPCDTIFCQNNGVTLYNHSIPGVATNFDGTNATCTNDYTRYWTVSPSSGFTIASGSLGDAFGTNGTDNLNIQFNQPGSYTVSLHVSNAQCSENIKSKTFCVIPTIDANFNPSKIELCTIDTISVVNLSSDKGCANSTMNYLWSVTSVNPDSCGVSNYQFLNSTVSSASPIFQFSGPGVYSVKLKTNLSPEVLGCTADSITKVITVRDKPEVSIIAPDTICQNLSATFSLDVNKCYAPSILSYNWSFPGSLSPSSSSSTTLGPHNVVFNNAGTASIQVSVQNTCGTTTTSKNLTVNPKVVTNVGSLTSVCDYDDIVLSGSITGGTNQGVWSLSPTNEGTISNGGTFSNSPQNSLSIDPGFTGQIDLLLTSADPSGPCPSTSATTQITVNAGATVNAGPDQYVCVGSQVNLSGSFTSPATSAQWVGGLGTFSPNRLNLNSIYTPSAAEMSLDSIVLTLATNNPAGACDSVTDKLVIYLKPLPQVTFNADITLCSPDTLQVEHQSSLAPEATNYTWNITNTTGLTFNSGTSGTIAYPNDELSIIVTNNDTVPRTLTYSVFATTNGCNGPINDTIITVQPLPQITPTPDVNVCSGDTIPFINFVSVPFSQNFTWVNDNINVGIVASGTGNIGPNLIAGLNASDTIMFAEIQVTPFFNGCPGPPDLFRVNVYPIPEVDYLPERTICSGDTILPIPWTSDVPGTTYEWTAVSSNSTSGFTPANGIGNTGIYTNVINNGTNLDTIAITVIPTVNGCQGPEYVYRIFVKPIPSVQVFADSICPGATSATLTAVGTPIGGSYQWLNGGPSLSSYTISNPADSSFYIVSYTVNGCINYDTSLVVYYDLPVLSVNNDSICKGQQGLLSVTTTPAQPGTYLWSAGTPSASGQQISASPNGTTTYTVT